MDTQLVIQRGINERRVLRLVYRSKSSGYTVRIVHPYALFWYRKVMDDARELYLSGLCHVRGDVRIFLVNRIVTASLTSTTFLPTGQSDMPEWAYRGQIIARV